jgi:alpha-L-fucosidase 2
MTSHSHDERIWHDRPAENEWLRALPLGNGRMGAMVFGTPGLERIQLNEDTFYALEPETSHYLPTGLPEALPGVVELLKEGKYREAEAIVGRNWLGRSNAPYLPLADLWIDASHSECSSYSHQLSLTEAVATCRYNAEGTTFTREAFLSFPDQVLAVRVSADTPGALSFTTWVDSPHRPTLRTHVEGNRFTAHGQGPGEALRRSPEQIEAWGDEPKYPDFYQQQPDGSWSRRPDSEGNILYGDVVNGQGMFFDVQLQVIPTGGRLFEQEGRLRVEGANEVLLLLSADTSFNGMDKSPSREGVDPSIQAGLDLDRAAARGVDDLKRRHVEDISTLFERVHLELGAPGPHADLPTDQRIARYHEGEDPTLPALYYNFSRYLMIAGSRPGSEPLNLQGIWNEEMIPPWNCGYTTNINAEMNYWDVLRGNLAECHEPFLRMIRETHENGKRVASELFGYRGWCMFHNLSIWRSAAPVDGIARTSWWPAGAGWFCQHLWHQFLMNRDRTFLEASFPVLRDAALFFCDWVIDRGDGKLVTPVSTSPENVFIYTDEEGVRQEASVCMGVTLDQAIVRETLTNTLSAAAELDLEFPEQDEIRDTLTALLGTQVAPNGTLMEWSEDFEEEDPEHRHISHLYGFFPGEEITPEKHPELIDAVRATLERRGDGASGWSMGWKLACWARLGDGAHFQKLLNNLLTPERTAQNMLCLHPPYQIDGNFGAARAITEALIQDHRGFIDLLPALPPDWAEGQVRGLRCRGGITVDLSWKNSVFHKGSVISDAGGTYEFRTGGHTFRLTLKPGKPTMLGPPK